MTMVLLIEVCKSHYIKDSFNLRIGDISGSFESLNAPKEDVLSEIMRELDELEGGITTKEKKEAKA